MFNKKKANKKVNKETNNKYDKKAHFVQLGQNS